MIPEYLPPGWLTTAEAELLDRVAFSCTGDILEVGCFRGRSTVILASFGRIVHCVDPFENFAKRDPTGEGILADFLSNTRHLPNIRLYRQKVENWNPTNVGFANLDGDHTYQGTVNQIMVAKKCGAKKITVHDVNDRGGGLEVKRACLELLGNWLERVGRLAVFNG